MIQSSLAVKMAASMGTPLHVNDEVLSCRCTGFTIHCHFEEPIFLFPDLVLLLINPRR
jgi:hypothetical protein